MPNAENKKRVCSCIMTLFFLCKCMYVAENIPFFTIFRDDKWNHTNSFAEDANSDYDDAENNSEVSDCTFSKSIGSSSSNYLDGTSHPGDLGSRVCSRKCLSFVLFAADL